MDENPKFKIDFFVMDEIYKIQDDDDRSKVFTNSLYRLSKTNADFYLIGPYFGKFSTNFLEKTNSKFFKFDAEIVQKDYIDLTKFEVKEKVSIGNVEVNNCKAADINLKNIIKNSNEQALVYVGDKRGVESKAKLIAKYLEQIEDKSGLIDYLETTFSKDWSLVNCLKMGVAFHHAGIPKFIQAEILDSFNNGEIKVIVCSPTIIEGVNTSAKQVLIYNNVKGPDPLTDFDVKNIYGRAGRFMQHFIGRSIALTVLPQSQEEKEIEFAFYDKELDSDELVQVDKEDLRQQNLEKRSQLEFYLKSQNVPFEIIKQNKFIPVQNQIQFIEFIRQQIHSLDLNFQSMPSVEQFKIIIDKLHEYLFVKKYKEDRKFPIWSLKYHSSGYVYRDLTLRQLIEQQEAVSIDTKIRRALDLITNYFEFALPKYLSTFQNLFNFVCEEKGFLDKKIKLDLLIMKLEYGVTEPHEIALKEAGIPIQIIKNISEVFRGCNDINEIREKFFNNKNIIDKLHLYEQKIFEKHI
jgi:ribonuclease BN (tRNA processing enzyme)